ncbi:MAG TPA: ribose-5-phosphate isomerase RpiA [Chitinophagaceae bacterium]|jgi:ribose 5-phosphate isomerase A|nr:ribose-5-phosphate isomerase RpiA [Chitinophagaceae bacterium]
MPSNDEIKKLAGSSAVKYVQPGMTIGIGTGSTVYWFIQELAMLIKQGMTCNCVPTSKETDLLAKQMGIPMLTLNDVARIDVTIDGADEIDPQLRLIKGGGSALLQEKMVAAASDELIIIADSSKLVKQLGVFPLPVEVIPYGWKQVQQRIQSAYNIQALLRMKDNKPLITDHGHNILDCHFGEIKDADQLTIQLNTIPGVVENGLFINMAQLAIIAFADGNITTLHAKHDLI